MRLGSSIRRRRGPGKKKTSSTKKKGKWRRAERLVSWLVSWARSVWSPRLGWTLGIVAVVGFGGGYLFSTQLLFPVPPPPGDLQVVPDLSGETAEDAQQTLTEAGLVLGSADSLKHPTVPTGVILGQSPLPGQLSLVGDTVRVAISTGPEERPVPDVLRLRGDRARTVLEASGFAVVMDSVDSDTPRGGVVSMEPEPGTEVAVPLEVRLVVSTGPPMVEMPLLLGLPEDQARSILDSLGMLVGRVETRFRFGRDQGMVVEQEPPASTMIQKGSAVRLVVGRRGG
jgi:serine/threonine-protein kinase